MVCMYRYLVFSVDFQKCRVLLDNLNRVENIVRLEDYGGQLLTNVDIAFVGCIS